MSLLNDFLADPTEDKLRAFCADWRKVSNSEEYWRKVPWLGRCLFYYFSIGSPEKSMHCNNICMQLRGERIEHLGGLQFDDKRAVFDDSFYANTLCYEDGYLSAWKHHQSTLILDLIKFKSYIESLEESNHGQIHTG
jgi:hypothetical protein